MSRKFFVAAILLFVAFRFASCKESKGGVAVGSIILADGSALSAAALSAIDGGNVPVAVVAGFNAEGKAFAVGVHRSENPLQWEADSSGKIGEKEKHPAAYFAKTYAKSHGIFGRWEGVWHLPEIDELRALYENRKIVNEALKKIHSLDKNAAMESLNTNWYWSSSQSEQQADYAWFVHFFNGYAGECPKNFTNVHAIVFCEF